MIQTTEYFTYQESQYDGVAQIDSVKGNTVVFNQLAKTLDSSNYGSIRATPTYSDGVCTYTTTSANTICGIYITSANFGAVAGHKYLFMCTVNPSITKTFRLGFDSITTVADELPVTASKDNQLSIVQTATQSDALVLYLRSNAVGDTAIVKNVMAVDLTQLADSRVTDYDSFVKYYSLPYYSYTQGELVSFNGNAIKTTGFNLFSFDNSAITDTTYVSHTFEDDAIRITAIQSTSSLVQAQTSIRFTVPSLLKGKSACFTTQGMSNSNSNHKSVCICEIYSSSGLLTDPTIFNTENNRKTYTVAIPQNAEYIILKIRIAQNASTYNVGVGDYTVVNGICMNISGDRNGEYEPYKTEVTSLPVADYFPTGMKSVGSVYDELTPTKSITRVGMVDLGNMSWTAVTANNITRMRSYDIKNIVKYPSSNAVKLNGICSKYPIETANNTYIGTLGLSSQNNGDIYIYDPNYTDASAFKTAMAGQYLYFELMNPLENYGVVDLNSLTWNYNATYSIFSAQITGMQTERKYKVLCSNYSYGVNNFAWASASTYADKSISTTNNDYVYIKDTSYSDVYTFKSAIYGVYLLYETTEPQAPDFNVMYEVHKGGTEEILPSGLLNGYIYLSSRDLVTSWQKESINSYGIANYYIDIADAYTGAENRCYCDKLPNQNTPIADTKTEGCYLTNGRLYIRIDSSKGSTVPDFYNWLQLHPMNFWYQTNTSVPSTSPLFADFKIYSQTDTLVPYRTFWLINGNGERWDFTKHELKSFLNEPQGLGFQKSIDITRYGERAVKNSETYNFPTVSGDLLFYDTPNYTRYEKYNEFVRFIMNQPITLYYQIPVRVYSRIADIYTLKCDVLQLTKTESKTNGMLTSNISLNGLEFYQGEEVVIKSSIYQTTIINDGDFPVGFEVEINGDFENPYFTLEQNGELYGEAKFDDTASYFSSVYVNSKDGEQNVVLKQNDSILPNPLAYQDLSISNGSIYVTFIKLAQGESTFTFGADNWSLSGYTIRFTPTYRSV